MKLLGFGELMVELRSDQKQSKNNFVISCAGDVFNTLAVAQKFGANTQFFSALGDDLFYEQIMERLLQFKVGTDFLAKEKGQTGIYFVKLKSDGQREFQFYRKGSAASKITPESLSKIGTKIFEPDALYTSAIASGISASCQAVAAQLMQSFFGNKKTVFYDLNYRSQLWSIDEAAQSFLKISKNISVLFLSEGELELVQYILSLPETDPTKIVKALAETGPQVVVYRLGSQGALGFSKTTKEILIAPTKEVMPLDTTGAGDVFSGAFVVDWLKTQSLMSAMNAGNNAALQKVQKMGTLDFLLD